MKPYRPSIRRLQLDFAQRLARKRMLAKIREKNPHPDKKIMDNSEPWLRDPRSVEDYWYIAQQVNERVKKWGPQATALSGS